MGFVVIINLSSQLTKNEIVIYIANRAGLLRSEGCPVTN